MNTLRTNIFEIPVILGDLVTVTSGLCAFITLPTFELSSRSQLRGSNRNCKKKLILMSQSFFSKGSVACYGYKHTSLVPDRVDLNYLT